ncbi:MAG: carbohydrate kinase family protein [Cyclobacteriaceae bacterium]|nr:carbohydrate kinase family protein [Cyclobacteriaceae bacterium]
MRKGIYAAGNWIIDDIKMIDEYPHQDGLTNVRAIKSNNGGAPYNVLKDLSFLEAPFPLYGAGLVGDDEKGKYIITDINKCKVNSSNLRATKNAPTSYTDVMTVASSGRRTFFHNRGANALFGRDELDLNNNAKIFHMAYLLLLDKMDEIDGSGRSVASYVFEEAQKKGFLTSTDIVSEASDRFQKVVPSSLPYINYLFVNEYEATRITGFEIVENGKINLDRAKEVVERIIDLGVKDYVILHFPEAAIACDSNKQKFIYPSVNVPSEMIKGATGAGDAFAAGVLLGLHENRPIRECLKFGACAAAASLFDESCSDAVRSLDEVLKLESKFGLKSV